MAQLAPADRSSVGPQLGCTDLPVLALSRPLEAMAAARRILESSADRRERSFAGQALGIAMRELGDVTGAVRQLRIALLDAATVSKSREADVEASLGGTLVYAGRSADALAVLQSAISKVRGAERARVLVRRGLLFQILGRTTEAVDDLRSAAQVLRRQGDNTWEIRAVVNLAQALIDLGDAPRADSALCRAELLLREADRTFEAATARYTRGLAAAMSGGIPEALAHYDAAEDMFAAAGARPAELSEARAAALLAAGLSADALASAEEAVAILRRAGASPAYRAQALVRASNAALSVGDHELARRYGGQAARLYTRQGRNRGTTQARLAIIRARYVQGERDRQLLRELAALVRYASEHRMSETIEASLLAGHVALELGDDTKATRYLGIAKGGRRSRSALSQILGWHAAALQANTRGSRKAKLLAFDRGLQALETHQLSLGAIETRMAATSHGRSLIKLALDDALQMGDARLFFAWAERLRATVFALPPVTMPHDAGLASDLLELRQTKRRLDEQTMQDRPVDRLERLCRQLEERIRRRTLRAMTTTTNVVDRLTVEDVLSSLDDVTIVELVPIDDTLYLLMISAEGVSLSPCGAYDAARKLSDFSRFALRRMTRTVSAERAWSSLRSSVQTVERGFFGRRLHDLAGGPVVLVPPASLASMPWGILPSLQDRELFIAPSAISWLRAKGLRPSTGSVVLVAGPNLRCAPTEIAGLAQLYPAAAVLSGSDATSDAVLRALDGSALAHIAAHGIFRTDNPMFSSLRLSDGALTVLDLQRLRSAPHIVVFSSCDSGSSSSIGFDEMLGVSSALIPLGTAGMVAAVVSIHDEAAASFSVRFHERLARSRSTADALRQVRLDAADPQSYATAHAFQAFGAR